MEAGAGSASRVETGPSKPGAGQSKSVKSFQEFKTAKGKQWFSKVKGKKTESKVVKEQDVLIYIGLLEWKDKQHALKPLRGKKLALRIPNTATYSLLRNKAEEKWRSFHSNLYDNELSYELLYEDGQKALFLPGSKELFSLSRYQEELGRDYNRITLYLCTSPDYNKAMDWYDSDDREEETEEMKLAPSSPPMKCARMDSMLDRDIRVVSLVDEDHGNDADSDNSVMLQIKNDEQLAKELQDQVNHEELLDLKAETVEQFNDSRSVVKALEDRVNCSQQLFLIVRRGAPFFRLLTLWQREANRSGAENTLRISYHGEQGIDSGAIGKEFLTQMMLNIGKTMFPQGSPINSTYHIQNGNFRACGQIAAVSLAQGGPAPRFLDECVYNLLINPEVDIKDLSPERNLTKSDRDILNSIQEDVTSHQEMIIEHGYTGNINQEHADDIIQSIVISIVTRRVVLMKEFMEGLQLYGLGKIILSNPESCRPLFVKPEGLQGNIHANDLFSMVQPEYSEPGSSRRQVEESVMDHLQDFLITLEDDGNITGYAAPITWNYEDPHEKDQTPSQPSDEFETPELTPQGVMGWLTGQKHRPLNGEELVITAKFDHDCQIRNPNHRICFPRVAACGREITFPITHMGTFEEFRNVFMIAYCNGQAFSNP